MKISGSTKTTIFSAILIIVAVAAFNYYMGWLSGQLHAERVEKRSLFLESVKDCKLQSVKITRYRNEIYDCGEYTVDYDRKDVGF